MSLKDLIKTVDWVAITTLASRWRMPDDAMSISFVKNKKSGVVDMIRIRFGYKVIEKVKWKAGDKISVMYDPDDLFTFLLAKTESGLGKTLGQESSNPVCTLAFKWPHSVVLLKEMNRKIVPFQAHDRYLSFRASNNVIENIE